MFLKRRDQMQPKEKQTLVFGKKKIITVINISLLLFYFGGLGWKRRLAGGNSANIVIL